MDAAELERVQALVRRALRSVPHGAEEDDLCQEVLLRLVAASDRVAPGALDAYAWTVARNLAVEKVRRRRSRRAADARLPVVRDRAEPSDESARVLRTAERRAVASALAALRPADRALLRDRYVDERPAEDVAERAGVTVRTLRVRLHRARARMLVQYVLLRRDLTVPPGCRRVLEAVASRDRSTQRRLGADAHLSTCPACASSAGALGVRARHGA